jgi:hypothetical protein
LSNPKAHHILGNGYNLGFQLMMMMMMITIIIIIIVIIIKSQLVKGSIDNVRIEDGVLVAIVVLLEANYPKWHQQSRSSSGATVP